MYMHTSAYYFAKKSKELRQLESKMNGTFMFIILSKNLKN